MRVADKHQLNDALRGYAARDFRAMLESLRHRAGLGQPPPLDPALPAHAVLPPSADDGPPVVVLEVHIPLVAGKASNEDPFAWTEDVEDFLAERVGPVTGLDDGEEIGDTYVFPLVGGGIGDLLFVAREIAALPGVPAGVYAVLTDSASVGSEDGRRIELGHPGSFGDGRA